MNNVNFKNGIGTTISLSDGVYSIDANSNAIIIDDITPHIGDTIHKGESIQNVFNELFNNILPSIPIIKDATMIMTNDHGIDDDYPEVGDLRKNAIYIRFAFLASDIPMYISCWMLQGKIEDLYFKFDELKLNSSKLDELNELISQKASLTQLLALQTQLNLKADNSTVNIIQNSLNKKAEASELKNIKTELLTKANKDDVDELNDLVLESLNTLNELTSNESITDINNIILNLQSQIDNKIDINKYNELNTLLDDKVDKNDFNQLKNIVDGFDETDLSEVNNKLNTLTSSFNTIKNDIKNVNNRINKKANTTYVDSIYDELVKNVSKLDSILENKADKSDIISKVDYSDLENLTYSIITINQKLSEINNEIDKKIDIIEVDKKISNTEHNIDNLRKTHINDITLLNSIITKLINKNDQLNETIKELQKNASKEWIKILTPEEYKRLLSTSIKSDQIYMCIKYGKPYALYIGKVLIAERNTVKDNGFTYTFPISF